MEWTDERRKRATRYAGPDYAKPRVIEIVVERFYADEEWSLDEFRDLLSRVPQEYADSAKVALSGGWDEGASLKITYAREETPAEVAERVENVARYVCEQEAAERASYERLKAKFG